MLTQKKEYQNTAMQVKKTLVIGASENKERYSNMAVQLLLQYKHPVVAVGAKQGKINNIVINKELVKEPDIDTITLYVNPTIQKSYYTYILSLQPMRIIFNPGTENLELQNLAIANNIETVEACTLVMLKTNQY
jgi:uncharacterized protein